MSEPLPASAPVRLEVPVCALNSCGKHAIYEMDIDRDERWIPLCIDCGPLYRRSTNIRIRTLRGLRRIVDGAR